MRSYFFIYAWLLATVLVSCGKESVAPPGTASLNIVNAVVGSSWLAPNVKGELPFDFYRLRLVQYGQFSTTNNHYSSYSGEQPLWIYNYPDTTDKDVPLLKMKLQLPIGSMHSLFMTGTLARPDSLLTEDHLPYHRLGDSTTGIRFMNLSPGSRPVKVVIQGKNKPEVTSIAYKTMSDFIIYPVNTYYGDYVFEFRDAASDAVITTYTATGIRNPPVPPNRHPWLYQNATLALIGVPGGTGAQQQTVMVVNYY